MYPKISSNSLSAQTGTSNPPARSRLEAFGEQLNFALTQSMELANRATYLADRLFGSTPQPVGDRDKEGESPSELRRLELMLEGVIAQLSVVNTHLGRVESL